MSDTHARDVRRIMETGDVLTDWQRAAVGGSTAQLRLPLRDKMDLRRLSEVLRVLANKLEVASGSRSLSDFEAVSMARTAVRMAQAQAASKPLGGKSSV